MVRTPRALELLGRVAELFGARLERPLFVVGTGRCGSTLLASLLDSHDRLARFPGEANELWHPRAFPYHRRQIELPPLVADAARFTERSLAAWPNRHEHRVRRALLGFLWTRPGRPTLCVKSAMISFMVPTIRELFPDARFVHLYRNGPSVVASLVAKEWRKYAGAFPDESAFRLAAAGYWRDCIRELDRQARRLGPDALLQVSYEQLCEAPRRVAERIARFAGLDPDRFAFDFSTVVSADYKAAGVERDPEWAVALEAMAGTMREKGYASPRG